MKYLTRLFSGALTFGLIVCFAAEKTEFNNEQLVETWAWIVAQEKGVAGIEISKAELSAFLTGLTSALQGHPSPYDLDKISNDVQKLAEVRREKAMQSVKHQNLAEASVFFAELKKKTNVITMRSGLCYETLQVGHGPFPKPEQTVNVHYLGHLLNGNEFIQMGPFDMILVTNHVSQGLFEGLQHINAGGKSRLYIPPSLAEADVEKMGTPPGAAMIFEIEVFDVKKTSPQDLADSLVPPAPELPPVPYSGRFTEQEVIENWGWNVGRQTGAFRFGFSETEHAAFLRGMAAAVKGGPPPHDLEKIYPSVEAFVRDRQEKARLAFKQKQLAAAASLFAELKKNTNVVELPSGLRYEIVQRGSGPYPKPGQILNVNYIGRLIDGRIFDRTDPTLGPLDIKIGTVLRGWDEGVQKINKGGKIKLYVPPSLGYGEIATAGVPSDSTLIFEIELLEIKDASPEETAAP